MSNAPLHHLRRGDARWPDELDVLEAAPVELWARGRLALLGRAPRIAVVGTRAPTPYGRDQCERFARRFAAAGAVVVSGLARGIDQVAHAAALETGGSTVAVLGSGVDRPWPAGPVTDRMLHEGLVLSELPPGTPPRRHHFPLRNRLISGLAAAVLVVEAAHASGSLITAHWAAEQGRGVFVLPGRVDHPMARGCHRLIREGATLVESPDEVLFELGLAPASPIEAGSPPVDGREHPILRALTGETLTVDELCARTGHSARDVLSAVVDLELGGHVRRAPGGLYRRT